MGHPVSVFSGMIGVRGVDGGRGNTHPSKSATDGAALVEAVQCRLRIPIRTQSRTHGIDKGCQPQEKIQLLRGKSKTGSTSNLLCAVVGHDSCYLSDG